MESLPLTKNLEFSLSLPIEGFLCKVLELLGLTAEIKISRDNPLDSLDTEILTAIQELNEFSKDFPEIKRHIRDHLKLAMVQAKIDDLKIDPDDTLVDKLESV